MIRLCAASLAVFGLLAAPALAEKLKGNIWDVSPLVVDGVEVTVTPLTRIERRGQPGLSAGDLRIGWKVQVEGERDGENRWTAKRVRVETAHEEEVRVRGFIDRLGPDFLDVGGERVLRQGIEPVELRAGMFVEGSGRRRDDSAVALDRFEVSEPHRSGAATKFLALAVIERDELERHLRFHEDPLLEGYIERIGRRLVPQWVDPDELRVRFRIVDDPEINLFACGDGAVLLHTGLLAALDSEAQLAVVLGHAVAHVVHAHGYRAREPRPGRDRRSLGSVVSASTIDVRSATWEGPAWASSLAEMGATVCLDRALRGHGPDLEEAADRIGLGYVLASGYDPFEAVAAWELLARHAATRTAPSPWFLGSPSVHRARVGRLTQVLNRDYRGIVEREGLLSNEEAYGRNVTRLRRLNAVMDDAFGEYRSAEEILRRVLARDAGDSVAHLYLGKVLWQIEGADAADEALGELRLAAELAPALAEPHREMGYIYEQLGFRESAVAAFERYVEMAPGAADASEVHARGLALR